jgi:hypothetical protein
VIDIGELIRLEKYDQINVLVEVHDRLPQSNWVADLTGDPFYIEIQFPNVKMRMELSKKVLGEGRK